MDLDTVAAAYGNRPLRLLVQRMQVPEESAYPSDEDIEGHLLIDSSR